MKDTHPLIAFAYFVAVIALTMCASQPVLAALSLLVALIYQFYLKGARATLRLLGLAGAIFVMVVAFGILFNHNGMTVLARFPDGNPLTLEAIWAAASMACVLAAVIVWFSCYQELVGADRFLALFSRLLPTTAMMVSMVFNFVPNMLRRAHEIDDAHRALAQVAGVTGAKTMGMQAPSHSKPLARLRWPVRLSTVLMGWSMESGLDTAASMRARAYGTARRTSYLPLAWTRRDAVLLVILIALAALAVAAEILLMSDFSFYPRMAALGEPWLYLPVAALFVAPLLYEGGVALRWRLSSF